MGKKECNERRKECELRKEREGRKLLGRKMESVRENIRKREIDDF